MKWIAFKIDDWFVMINDWIDSCATFACGLDALLTRRARWAKCGNAVGNEIWSAHLTFYTGLFIHWHSLRCVLADCDALFKCSILGVLHFLCLRCCCKYGIVCFIGYCLMLFCAWMKALLSAKCCRQFAPVVSVVIESRKCCNQEVDQILYLYLVAFQPKSPQNWASG